MYVYRIRSTVSSFSHTALEHFLFYFITIPMDMEKKNRQARKVPKARNEVKERKHLPSAEPSVRETSDVEGETGTNYQTRRLQHLRHT